MNWPNALTLFRIFLLPVFLIAVIYNRVGIALILFLLAAVTDLLDGLLARRLRQETKLGLYLDPVADKLLMTVAFVALTVKGWLPAWLAVLVVSRDLFIILGVAIVHFSGQKLNLAPTTWGKQTTVLQALFIIVALTAAASARGGFLLMPLAVLTGFATIFSGVHYVLHGLRAFPAGGGPGRLG